MTYQTAPATDAQVDHIASLVHAARPEWDVMVIKVILGSHRHQCAGNDLAIAALRAAANERFLTPKGIGWRGPHWDGLDTKPVEVQSIERCSVCGKPEPRCYSERPGIDDDHHFAPNRQLVKT